MKGNKSDETNWSNVIHSEKRIFSLNLKEIFIFRNLLFRFIYRDFVTFYKQTILGPLWFFIQPIMVMLTYVAVFGNIAKISTDGIPQPLFYLSGIIVWNYFTECFLKISDTFNENQNVFGKVFFPRLIIPLSKVISGLLKFFIQFILFLIFYIYYINKGVLINPSILILTFPFLIFLVAVIGLGLGLFFTSITVKYRDLKFFIQFGIQLLMFASPVIYPLSSVSDGLSDSKFRLFMYLNPFTHILETFRYIFLGKGEVYLNGLIYTIFFSISVLIIGILTFNNSERNFIDKI
tara:strand:+ start:89 stop:964 length:876 start_codon:yes stop_codon:yes gene_type:complete